jgi:peptide/nickel transport system permease protein
VKSLKQGRAERLRAGLPRYIIGRVLWALIAIAAVVTITFLLIYVIPSNPISAVLGGRANAAQLATIERQYGFNQPVWLQYVHFWRQLLHGNLGFSFASHQEVRPAIVSRIGATALLAVSGLFLELLIGVSAGIFAARARGTIRDRGTMGVVIVGLGVPPFLMGLLLIYVFAFKFPIFPISGYGGISHLVLPAFTVGLTGGAYYARLLRGQLVEAMDADFVRASRSRGMSERSIFVRHTLRNSILVVVTWIGMDLGYFLSGIIAVEAIFDWPGIGNLAYQAISTYDTPMILGTVLVSALAIVTMNLIIDLLYPLLDPRLARR